MPCSAQPHAALGVTLSDDLLTWSPVKAGGTQRMLGGHAFPAKVILEPQIRGCPVCLRADAAGSTAPPHIARALRGHWLVPHVTLCLDHHYPLVPLWRDPQPVSRFDSVARFREIAAEILAERLNRETRDPTDFDLRLDARPDRRRARRLARGAAAPRRRHLLPASRNGAAAAGAAPAGVGQAKRPMGALPNGIRGRVPEERGDP